MSVNVKRLSCEDYSSFDRLFFRSYGRRMRYVLSSNAGGISIVGQEVEKLARRLLSRIHFQITFDRIFEGLTEDIVADAPSNASRCVRVCIYTYLDRRTFWQASIGLRIRKRYKTYCRINRASRKEQIVKEVNGISDNQLTYLLWFIILLRADGN